MKRIVALLMVILTCFSMSGCFYVYYRLNKDQGRPSVFEMEEEVIKTRPNFQLGTCRDLQGQVAVHFFFMNDAVSSWEENSHFLYIKEQVNPALFFLMEQADEWGVELSFSIESVQVIDYPGVMPSSPDSSGTGIDPLEVAAEQLGYIDEVDMMDILSDQGRQEVIPVVVANKEGSSYVNVAEPHVADGSILLETLYLFNTPSGCDDPHEEGGQSSGIVFYILRIYGAENMFTVADRDRMGRYLYPKDVMYRKYGDYTDMKIGDFTAYCVGWTQEIPDVCYMPDWWE